MEQSVYGVKVDEKDYELVQKIAGLLHGHSEYGWGKAQPESEGWKKCAKIAAKAVAEAKKL